MHEVTKKYVERNLRAKNVQPFLKKRNYQKQRLAHSKSDCFGIRFATGMLTNMLNMIKKQFKEV